MKKGSKTHEVKTIKIIPINKTIKTIPINKPPAKVSIHIKLI